jgi:hypothetical protein
MFGALYFKRCLRQRSTFFTAVADSASKFFCDVGDSAKKYKTAIFKPKPSKIVFFGLVPRSPTYTGLICVKTLEPNISSLGAFKLASHSQHPPPPPSLKHPAFSMVYWACNHQEK